MKQFLRWPDVVLLAQRWKSDPDSCRECTYQDGAFNRLVVTDMAESWESPVIRKLLVGSNLRERFLEELRRKCIQEEQLFPGKDFCEPLKLELHSTVQRFRTDREEEIKAAEEAIALGG